jgi:hypothetical protein
VDRPVRERIGEGIVDEPVLVDERQPGEAGARDADLEMIAAARTVDDRELGRIRKRSAEQLLEAGAHAREASRREPG